MKDKTLLESIPKPQQFDASKWVIDLPFPAEHPYNSHIPRFALFPSPDRFEQQQQRQQTKRSASAPLQPSASTGSSDAISNSGGAISLPKPVIVESKTAGYGARCERIVLSADTTSTRWPENSFDQVPKHIGAKRQVYPIPPKLFAPNQELDLQRQRYNEQQQFATAIERLYSDSGTDTVDRMTSSKSTSASGRSKQQTSKVIGAPCADARQTLQVSDAHSDPTLSAGYSWHSEGNQPTDHVTSIHCGNTKKTTSTDAAVKNTNRLCYSCPPRGKVVVQTTEPRGQQVTYRQERHVSFKSVSSPDDVTPQRPMTLNEREEHRLLNGKDYVNLPPDKCPSDLHPAYSEGYSKSENAFSGLRDCNKYHETNCDPAAADREPNYKRIIREQHDRHQQMEASNRWKELELQTAAHDIGALRRKMALSSVKHEPEVFYDHEGRYQRERAGLYKTSYAPELLEYAMNAEQQSGGQLSDLSRIERSLLDLPTTLNEDVAEALRRARGHPTAGSVAQYNPQPTAYEMLRPFEIAKSLQKHHLNPNAATADIRTQEGDIVWTHLSTYQGDYNTKRYLHENFPLSIHARKDPTQVLSAENQDLDSVRLHGRTAAAKSRPSDGSGLFNPGAPANCDQYAQSGGTRQTLAANLYLLNDPSTTATASATTRWSAPRQKPSIQSEISAVSDRHDPRLDAISYDLSAHSNRVDKFAPEWSDCRRPNPTSSESAKSTAQRARRQPISIPTKAEILARFNEQNAKEGPPPADLRKSSMHGRKHVFVGNTHSQQLRGCMLVA